MWLTLAFWSDFCSWTLHTVWLKTKKYKRSWKTTSSMRENVLRIRCTVCYVVVELSTDNVCYWPFVFPRRGMCARMRWWQLKRCPTVANSLMRWDKIGCVYIIVQTLTINIFTQPRKYSTSNHSPLTLHACAHSHVTMWNMAYLRVVRPGLINVESEETGLERSNLENWQVFTQQHFSRLLW